MFEKFAFDTALEIMPNYLWNNIHWTLVILLSIASIALGALWHQKFHVLGQIWQSENYPNGMPPKDSMNLKRMFGGTIISHFVICAILSALVSGHGTGFGLLIGLGLSIGFVITTMAPTYFFANRSSKLLAVDAGFYVVFLSLAGGTFGSF